MSSDFLDLTPRDNYISWERNLKQKKMINHTCISSTIVPIQHISLQSSRWQTLGTFMPIRYG